MGMRDIGRFLHLAQEVRCCEKRTPTHASPALKHNTTISLSPSPVRLFLFPTYSPIYLALQVGLYVLLRPSPYICAEWDYGGMSALQLLSGERDPQVSGIEAN